MSDSAQNISQQPNNKQPITNAIAPVIKFKSYKPYFQKTQSLLATLQEKLQTTILVYYVPNKYQIASEHVNYFLEILKDIGEKEKISLILYSRGGEGEASVRIVNLIRDYCKSLEVIAPEMCSSAATKLALGADKILMTSVSFLTPIDKQSEFKLNQDNNIGTVHNLIACDSLYRIIDILKGQGLSADESEKQERIYTTLFKYFHPSYIGETLRIAKASEMDGVKLMKTHLQSFENEEKINWIAKHLVYDYPAHYYPILYQEAKEIGLPVEKLDKETTYLLWDLLKYYQVSTREADTLLGEGKYHVEETLVILETLGKRVFKKYSFNRRYSVYDKTWSTLDDNTQWLKYLPSEDPAKDHESVAIQEEEIKINPTPGDSKLEVKS